MWRMLFLPQPPFNSPLWTVEESEPPKKLATRKDLLGVYPTRVHIRMDKT
jgi:hypothetical protein